VNVLPVHIAEPRPARLHGVRGYVVVCALWAMLGAAILTVSDREHTVAGETRSQYVYEPSVVASLRVPTGFSRLHSCPGPQSPPHACFLERAPAVLNQAAMSRFIVQTGASPSRAKFDGCSGPLRLPGRHQSFVSCAAHARVGKEDMWLFAQQAVVLTPTSFLESHRTFAHISPGIHIEVVGLGTCVKYCKE
jgi:hypothetical protein